jgi:hypothetical protein
MCPRVPLFRPLLLASFVLAAGHPLNAQIAAKSPFMPPQGAASSGPTVSAPLEYRGYLATSGGRLFRIYDPTKKASTWVKVDEPNADFGVTAKQYDEAQKTLTIEYQGKTLTLAERESKVISSGAAAAAMPPPVLGTPATNVSPAVTQAVVLNPTPADEQRRLDAVAAEVARRRALREQAAQQMNQVTPQNNMPGAMQPQVPGQPGRTFQALPPQPPYPQQNPSNQPRTRTPQSGAVRQQ